MAGDHPGAVRRFGLTVVRLAPAKLLWPLIRLNSPKFTMGAIALIEYDGRLLALRQTHRRGVSLPGGLLERGESPAQAVAREVQEETGLRIEPGDVFATTFETRLRHIDVIFRVHCAHEPRIRVASEATGYEWLGLPDWVDHDRATERILTAVRAAGHEARAGTVLAG